jgi:uncharacterized protein
MLATVAAAVALVVVQVASVAELDSPRPTAWVMDQAGVLSDADEAALNALASQLHADKGIELAVVTVDDTPGAAKPFATELFNAWGIGDARTNTGVLVLLVMGKRRIEVETGTGIEAALPADWLVAMQGEHMVPRFKQQDFAGGLVAGVTAIDARLRGAGAESTSTDPAGTYRSSGTDPAGAGGGAGGAAGATGNRAYEPDTATAPSDAGGDSGSNTGLLVGGGLGLLGAGGGGALLVRHRRRQRRCEKHSPPPPMIPLSEVEDDAKLDAGQRTEEQVGSVDYEVLVCPQCQDSRTLRHGKWFSGYGRCSSCSYKTLKSTSTTLVSATYDHGGQVEVVENCAHCNHHSRRIRHTAKLTRSSSGGSSWGRSSSFSSGGGSRSSGFGGGSSRGGGGGSSW